MRILTSSALIAASLAGAAVLSGCTDGGRRGYGGVEIGYNASYGDPYWGWYGDYYYPGTGVYVYDSHRRRTTWNDSQRSYWEGRRSGWHGDRGRMRDNWRSFRRR